MAEREFFCTQKFSVASGLLLSEALIATNSAGMGCVSCFTPGGRSLWAIGFPAATSAAAARLFCLPAPETPDAPLPWCDHSDASVTGEISTSSLSDYTASFEVPDAVEVTASTTLQAARSAVEDPLAGFSAVPATAAAVPAAQAVSSSQAALAVLRFLDPLTKPAAGRQLFRVELTPSAFATLRRALGLLAPALSTPETDGNSPILSLQIQGLLVTLQARASVVLKCFNMLSAYLSLCRHCRRT